MRSWGKPVESAWRGAAFVGLVAMLAACGPTGPSPLPPRAPASDRPTLANPVGDGTVRVGAGDTVYTVARRLGVTTRALIEANDLAPPYQLRSGMVLRVPGQQQYVVRRGDTIYALSRRFGVDMRTLVSLNGIAPPYTIYVGQALKLPGPAGQTRPPTAVAAAPATPPPPPASAPPSPAAREPVTAAPLPTPAAPPIPTEPPRGSAEPGPPVPVEAPRVEPRRLAAITPPPREAQRFLWPVRGRVLSTYGPKSGGLHNDGINIAAPRGTPVLAAESGIVVYAGNELKGFGNLVLLKHADGWVTAYAHNDALLVERGQTVRRGEVIARVGQTGSVTAPQLHFEIRQGAKALDPRPHLEPARAMSATGEAVARR